MTRTKATYTDNKNQPITKAKRNLTTARRSGDAKAIREAMAEKAFIELSDEVDHKAFLLTIAQRRALIEKLLELDRQELI